VIDHIGIEVKDYERARDFYLAALAPLGYVLVMEFDGVAGLGARGEPDLWIHRGGATRPRLHLALRAETRAQVDAFHAAALAAGATDNGAPGLRPQYHPDYYGAFVIDPEGHNLEAVCHAP